MSASHPNNPSQHATERPRPEASPIRTGRHSCCVLGVGIAALDIINQVDRYPAEDDEVRASAQRIRRGGNCANTLATLSELGHRGRWVGTLADDGAADLIRNDLNGRGIGLDDASIIRGGATPTSYITLSQATGSRTIVHYRDLPELSAADFARVDLNGVDWAHFEGRNPVEVEQMIARVTTERPDVPISVEIEKPRPEIERLFQLPDDRQTLLIISRAFAERHGRVEPESFLERFAAQSRARLLLLPWGADGAYARSADGELFFAPAQPPDRILDTIAAGDVFNAAALDALLHNAGPAAVLEQANALAGRSCGQHGIDGLLSNAPEVA
ncbi:MAG: ketohexokinase [Gammaproteobacteria bacterium]|nr:ketohexokinase [Gammaproteobacteria bacterium]